MSSMQAGAARLAFLIRSFLAVAVLALLPVSGNLITAAMALPGSPTVTGVSPTSGPDSGGTTVTVTGTNFTPGSTTVVFGDAGHSVPGTVTSTTQLTALSPPHGTGTVDITVSTPAGASAANPPADQFTYGQPVITQVGPPNTGPATGGTALTINGSGFFGGQPGSDVTSLKFGNSVVPSANYTVDSDTQISVNATPAYHTGDPKTVDVVVTTSHGGASATSSSDHFTYTFPTPAVTSVNTPNTRSDGPTTGGTIATIQGSGFTGASTVKFGSTAASYTVNSDSQITATSPAGSAGGQQVDVTVTTPGGTSPTGAADKFTYVPVPTVTALSPTSGPEAGGTTVTITGTHFQGFSGVGGVTAVKFGATDATSFTVSSDTSISAHSPAGTGTVHVTVTNDGGTSATSTADQFTYVPAPTVSSVNPASGPTAGATNVTITGTNFQASGVTTVTFGGVPATAVVATSATTITATTPAHTAGGVDVVVTNPDGQASGTTGNGKYTYVAPPSNLVVSPNRGRASGNQLVTITGNGFQSAGTTTVTFGGTPATGVTVVDSHTIHAVTPAHAAGPVNVAVTNPDGQSATANNAFTYVAAPAVSLVNPNVGPSAGGNTVVVSGSGFWGGTGASNVSAVTIHNGGDTAVTSFTVNSDTQVTINSMPGHAAGSTDIQVTTDGGTSAIDDSGCASAPCTRYTFQAPHPTVTSLAPSFGPTAGGYQVVITGTGLTAATAVHFGTHSASFTVDSDTQVTVASIPAGDAAGPVDVTVTTGGGTSSAGAGDKFTYVDPPTVTGVSPASGPTPGGTAVTITGTNFQGFNGVGPATRVEFGTTNAPGFTVVDATHITVSSPPSPAYATGPVDVRVTTGGGKSAVNTAGCPSGSCDRYTYVLAPAPTLASVSPGDGPVAGGTVVQVNGSNFLPTPTVTFGGASATAVVYDSPTQLHATTPAGTAGPVDVVVTNPDGQSVKLSGGYTYVAVPTVTSISPSSGPTAGGGTLVINGTHLDGYQGTGGATAVHIGTQSAPFTISGQQITVTAIPAATAAGPVHVTVTTDGGTSPTSNADLYTYVDPPTITGISPSAGPLAGGTTVVITGTNFTGSGGAGGATAVKFGTADATSFTVDSATQVTAHSPAHAAGLVDVTVVTAGGTSATSNADHYTFAAAPTVTGISPTAGPTAGGTTVTITGTGFTGASGVMFGANGATFSVIDDAHIHATSPAGSASGEQVHVTVTGPGGSSSNGTPDLFTYVPAPTVSGIAPTSGPEAGGTSVTITGTHFQGFGGAGGATSLHFGGAQVNAGGFTVNSDTSITVNSPSGTGTVHVTVTNAGGTSPTSAADQFSYVARAAVTAVTPNHGPNMGGTTVNITGSHFTGATLVSFGSTSAGFTVVNDTTIRATSPAGDGTARTVHITVTTPSGTSSTGGADQFTYADGLVAVTGTDGALSVKLDQLGYTNLGGHLIGAPAVVTLPNGSALGAPLYFGVGTDHDVWVRSGNLGWQPLSADGPVNCLDNPAASVTTVSGHSVVTLACEAGDLSLWRARFTATAGSLPSTHGADWAGLGGRLSAGPAVANVAGDTVPTYFVLGTDGQVYIQREGAGTYTPSGWRCIGHPAVSSAGGTTYFACNGSDHQLWYASNSGGGWTPASPGGGYLVDGVGVAAYTTGAIFYVEGPDGHLYEETLSGAGLSGYRLDGGSITHGVAATNL